MPLQEAEKRLKDILSGKRPNGAITTANGAPKSTGTQRRAGQPLLFSVSVHATACHSAAHALSRTAQSFFSQRCSDMLAPYVSAAVLPTSCSPGGMRAVCVLSCAHRPGPPLLQAKVELGDETRVLNLTGQATYSELLHVVKEKFPTSGPFALKYLDR